MRKKIFTGLFALALLATAGYGVQKTMKSDANLSDLALANVEALAQLEEGCDECHIDNYGREAKTVRCKLELGGGWFTTSVARVCEIVADASKNCIPVECGGYF